MLKLNSRSDRGSAIAELAYVLPLLSLVLIGAAELGRIAYFAIEVSNAARAGAAYGAQNSGTAATQNSTAESAITTAALDDAPELAKVATSFTATAVTVEDCETVNSNSGAVTENPSPPVPYPMVTPCATSTTTGVTNTIVNYVQVTTQATVKTMLKYPGIPTSFTLNGFAQMRVIQN
ncbi:MAG TPA: TadE family protein [Bryobacteraceae bacterium]|jgi:Flp pilus assembly protein TadG